MTISSGLSHDAPPVCLWKENPNRLVSLLEIVHYFPVCDVYLMLKNMGSIREQCDDIISRTHGGHRVPPYIGKELRFFLPEWQRLCSGIGAKNASVAVMLLGASFGLEEEEPVMDVSQCRTELAHVIGMLEYALEHEHSYAHIVPERRVFAFEEHLFGTEVSEAFPQAKYDIRQAGDCFAVDANSAAIFHMMRVAEYGLRALAYDRRVTVPRGPIDLATWEDIIKQLEAAEQAIHTYPRTHAREAQFEFYHSAMMDLRSFKNVWRNRYMHTRSPVDEDDERYEAEKVMLRVGDFIKRLASTISEKKRTPVVWKRAYNKG